LIASLLCGNHILILVAYGPAGYTGAESSCFTTDGSGNMINPTHALTAAALAFALTAAGPTNAETYPDKPVRFIVAFPPGGPTAIGARVIASYLTGVFGQQVYVENKSGATGMIGSEVAAKSAADGYTILVAPDSLLSNAHVFKMNIAPLKDL